MTRALSQLNLDAMADRAHTPAAPRPPPLVTASSAADVVVGQGGEGGSDNGGGNGGGGARVIVEWTQILVVVSRWVRLPRRRVRYVLCVLFCSVPLKVHKRFCLHGLARFVPPHLTPPVVPRRAAPCQSGQRVRPVRGDAAAGAAAAAVARDRAAARHRGTVRGRAAAATAATGAAGALGLSGEGEGAGAGAGAAASTERSADAGDGPVIRGRAFVTAHA
jgi:hypothetical protein